MNMPANPSPREFGEALRKAREKAGIDLETIAARTKISRRVLEAFEAGAFDRLPSGSFPRLFLRQFVALIGEDPEPWARTFDRALDRHLSASQPIPVVAAEPAPGRRIGPWIIGLVLVVAAIVGVVIVERQQQGELPGDAVPTPEALLAATAPAATPTAVPVPTPAVDPGVLVVRATTRSCWVQVRVEGENPVSRLLAAGTDWEVAAGGRPADLVLGDAGGVEVEYLGAVHRQLGGDGEVVRLSLGPPPPTPPAAH